MSDVRYLYRTLDTDIGHWIKISDVGYRYWMSDIDFGNIGVILS